MWPSGLSLKAQALLLLIHIWKVDKMLFKSGWRMLGRFTTTHSTTSQSQTRKKSATTTTNVSLEISILGLICPILRSDNSYKKRVMEDWRVKISCLKIEAAMLYSVSFRRDSSILIQPINMIEIVMSMIQVPKTGIQLGVIEFLCQEIHSARKSCCKMFLKVMT